MYHELETSRSTVSNNQPGYLRYVVRADDFRDQLAWLKANGFSGLAVGEALRLDSAAQKAVVITFDDGTATDLTVAAPMLKEFGFSATFYTTSGFLGKRGYLNPAQVRELCQLGFEIGCHSRTHRFLNDLPLAELEQEIDRPKRELEAIIGSSVEHYSCPGGRWNQAALEVAKRAGYKSVATSRIGRNSARANRYTLARVAVMRGSQLTSFKRLCLGNGLMLLQSRMYLLQGLKSILGNSVYERWRSAALPHSDSQ